MKQYNLKKVQFNFSLFLNSTYIILFFFLFKEEVTPIAVKTETIKLKESARKSINTRRDIAAIRSSESCEPSTSRNNSSHIPNSIPNHVNSTTAKAFNKKEKFTARKSMYSSHSPQNSFSDSNNRKQTLDTKTIVLTDKPFQDTDVHSLPIEIHVTESKSSKKLLLNNKAATTSLNTPKDELPFAKLKERGISISSNVKSDKRSSSGAITTNSDNNTGKLTTNAQLNSNILNGVFENQTLTNNAQCNKRVHNSTKFDKDVPLSWSKKRKLSENDESKPRSVPESRVHKIIVKNIESTAGSQFKSDSSMSNDSKLESQTKSELNKKLTTKKESVSQSKHELFKIKPISTDMKAQSKRTSSSINLNSEATDNELKGKLSKNDESKPRSVPESLERKKTVKNNESSAGSQFKTDSSTNRKLPMCNDSKLESQSISELNKKLTTKNESVSQSICEPFKIKPISTYTKAQSKIPSSSVILNSETTEREGRFLSSGHIITVSSDGIAEIKSDKELVSLDADVIFLDAPEKTNAAGSSTDRKSPIAGNKTASEVVNNSTKSASFQDVIHILASKPIPASEKVEQYLLSNSTLTETAVRQPKEVTSPKLSLKRKRQEEGEQLNSAKKGLFSNEGSKEILAERPSHNEDPTSSANKENKSIAVNYSANRDAKHDIPGPSHETCSVESNKQKFEMLMDFVLMESRLSSWEEKSQMRHNFFKSLEKASEQFISSLDFSNLIDTIFANIRKHPHKISQFLLDLRIQLRENRTHDQCEVESPSKNKVIKNVPSGNSVVSEPDFKKRETLEMPSRSLSDKKTEKNFNVHNLKKSESMKSEKKVRLSAIPILSAEEAQKKLDEKISKLDNHMEKLHKKLKILQAKELSLDDLNDEDSTYILEDRYKKRILEIHKTWCRLKNQSARLKFEMERRYFFKGTRYHEINQAVENLINKRKKVDKFPSYVDIFNLVKATNESINLGIKESEYSSLARDIFEEVGNELKKRRRKDEEYNFGCYLTDDVKLEEDPAEGDEELKMKLTNSVIQGEQKLKELIEKYAAQQESVGSEEEANVEEGSEQEEANADDVSEQEEADNESEQDDANDKREQDDANAEYDDDNLPSTNPATPTAEEPGEPTSIIQKRDINVVTVGSDSDVSTDPGFHIEKNNFNTTLTVDSDNSCDLPPIDIPFY
ncbi:uro-adherence factor A isoform X2 [Parasteatoda tepidariorum]|uniref:uro-adherence factor A isoform X2 n=1 Tax=Parasteatoda tepidariorum TaxID=114398 RepID=UPI001C7280EA|nr:serine-rich adhesin for platelets isoform X2 [Parasteatoda tepidariorum]